MRSITSSPDATWGWVIFAAVVSVLPALTDAFPSQGGMGTQLPLGGLTMLNVGGKFINVAVPASVGQAAVNIRFAQKCGVSTGTASSGGRAGIIDRSCCAPRPPWTPVDRRLIADGPTRRQRSPRSIQAGRLPASTRRPIEQPGPVAWSWSER